jgi:cytochrome c oxidase assembly protein subunit 15
MSQSENNLWLHRFAVITAAATVALLGIGGLVTSHEAGMSVPDWPTSYGYNMFLFPLSKWWHAGNIFYEHSHRLLASGVGLLTTILAVWLWLKDSRAWLRWLGFLAFAAIVLQGVLGGLRVTEHKDALGIFHGTLAQLFFVLVCALALFTSRWWQGWRDAAPMPGISRGLGWLLVGTTTLIVSQLVLGATMRHQHAGLAIPDFPLAYGKLWPAMDADSVARYNQQRVEVMVVNPITAAQIALQMAHRIVAVLILSAVISCVWLTLRRFGWRSPLSTLACVWLGLILAQVTFGVATVVSDKAADIATAHVLLGALSLATGALLSTMYLRNLNSPHGRSVLSAARRENNPGGSFGVEPGTAAMRS